MSSPAIRSVAKRYGYCVETANQTTYPDFTLTNLDTHHRIALDIKTTYLRNRMGFTLGGYNSFLRNNRKNILYPYDSYTDHWVLGFVYKQSAPFMEYDLDNLPPRGQIPCPYEVQAVFIREKHELCGLRAGSGNTKNIGSFIATDVQQFVDSSGPFASFRDGKSACDLYWANYEKYVSQIYSEDDLIYHPDFQCFK